MKRQPAVLDIELFNNFLLIAIRLIGSDNIVTFIKDENNEPDWDKLRRILRKYTLVTYNGMNFDVPLIVMALEGASVAELKAAANRIIQGGIKWWDVERELNIGIPQWIDHIDLIEPQPNPFASLKILNGRLHGRSMQDLPYEHDAVLTEEQKQRVIFYCRNDLDATELLWNSLQEAISIREAVSEEIGIDCRSKSDTQMGSAIFKRKVEQETGERIQKPEYKPGQSFNYVAPDFIRFETEQLQTVLRRIQEHTFVVGPDGKVKLPDWLSNEKIAIGPSTFQMGIGGLHSTESNRCVLSDDEKKIVSVDVASYYPASIINLGLYPHAVGPKFIDAYRGLRDDRIAAKKAGNKVLDKSYKTAINGSFGLLGSKYSFMFAPHLLIAVTLTGQLALLMLIERAFLKGIPAISANTDGTEFLCPVEYYGGLNGDRVVSGLLKDVLEQWEQDTGYVLEAVEYKALFNQSVNSYFALKANGGHKRKGPFTNPWNEDKNDFDSRGQLMKNPQMTICSDAALAFIKHGIPVRRTIESCADIRQFITVIKVTKGATWNGEYLGKTVRYYWGVNGQPIYEAVANPKTGVFKKVPKTDGSVECMTLPDELPDDIEYERYVEETEKILREIGYYGQKREKVKRVRFTKANGLNVLKEWMVTI